MFVRNYELEQAKWIEDKIVNVGDLVKIIRRPTEKEEEVWKGKTWVPMMDRFIGKIFKIEKVYNSGIGISSIIWGPFIFPFYVFEVEEELKKDDKVYYTENYKESISLIGEEVVGCSNPEFEDKCYTGILRGFEVDNNGVASFKIRNEDDVVNTIYYKKYIKRNKPSPPPILPFTPDVDPSKIVGKIVVQKAIHKKYFLVVGMNGSYVKIADEWISFKELFENYVFLDESPCGEVEDYDK